MPKPDDDRSQPKTPPVRPPTLPPDFPDIPQNPSSELQPPPSPSATADKFAGTTPAPTGPETLRRQNARLGAKINQVLEKHPELRDVTEEIALRQDMHVQERARQVTRTSARA
jgi:hypothetical protein